MVGVRLVEVGLTWGDWHAPEPLQEKNEKKMKYFSAHW
jgi:hypothetical protein